MDRTPVRHRCTSVLYVINEINEELGQGNLPRTPVGNPWTNGKLLLPSIAPVSGTRLEDLCQGEFIKGRSACQGKKPLNIGPVPAKPQNIVQNLWKGAVKRPQFGGKIFSRYLHFRIFRSHCNYDGSAREVPGSAKHKEMNEAPFSEVRGECLPAQLGRTGFRWLW